MPTKSGRKKQKDYIKPARYPRQYQANKRYAKANQDVSQAFDYQYTSNWTLVKMTAKRIEKEAQSAARLSAGVEPQMAEKDHERTDEKIRLLNRIKVTFSDDNTIKSCIATGEKESDYLKKERRAAHVLLQILNSSGEWSFEKTGITKKQYYHLFYALFHALKKKRRSMIQHVKLTDLLLFIYYKKWVSMDDLKKNFSFSGITFSRLIKQLVKAGLIVFRRKYSANMWYISKSGQQFIETIISSV